MSTINVCHFCFLGILPNKSACRDPFFFALPKSPSRVKPLIRQYKHRLSTPFLGTALRIRAAATIGRAHIKNSIETVRQIPLLLRYTSERKVIAVVMAQVPGRDQEEEITRMMITYGGMLARLCTALLNDPDLAQDMTQETFLRAYRSMTRHHRAMDNEQAWLTRIAINLCRDQWRTRWFRHIDRRVTLDMLPEPVAPMEEPDTRIFEAVQSLPIKLREVVLLRYFQDMALSDIPRVLGVSRATVYRRLDQALASLRETLEGENDNE